jgi:hypothetical protein
MSRDTESTQEVPIYDDSLNHEEQRSRKRKFIKGLLTVAIIPGGVGTFILICALFKIEYFPAYATWNAGTIAYIMMMYIGMAICLIWAISIYFGKDSTMIVYPKKLCYKNNCVDFSEVKIYWDVPTQDRAGIKASQSKYLVIRWKGTLKYRLIPLTDWSFDADKLKMAFKNSNAEFIETLPSGVHGLTNLYNHWKTELGKR